MRAEMISATETQTALSNGQRAFFWAQGCEAFASDTDTNNVNGCDASPVVFLEGIYVIPSARRKDVAKALCAPVEQWGLSQGCAEFASDTDINNTDAQTIHEALGFTEMERVVVYKKRCKPD